jgi:hypothetical protein
MLMEANTLCAMRTEEAEQMKRMITDELYDIAQRLTDGID